MNPPDEDNKDVTTETDATEGDAKEQQDAPLEAPSYEGPKDIYEAARRARATEEGGEAEAMSEAQRIHMARMELEARGIEDAGELDGIQANEWDEETGEVDGAVVAKSAEPSGEAAQAELETPASYEIVVFGEKHTVSAEEVQKAGGLEALQKNRAADVRLERLSQQAEKLRTWEQRLRLAEQGSQEEAPTTQAKAKATESQPDFRTLAKTIVNSLYEGEEAEAIEKIAETFSAVTRGGTDHPAANPEELRMLVREELASLQQPAKGADSEDEARKRASDAFRNEFPDLQDNAAAFAATRADIEVVRNDPLFEGRAWEEVVREAGYRTRARLAGLPVPRTPSQGPAPVVPNPLAIGVGPSASSPGRVQQQPPADISARYSLKARTVVPPSSSAASAGSPPTANQRVKPSDIVQGMREARGLPRTS